MGCAIVLLHAPPTPNTHTRGMVLTSRAWPRTGGRVTNTNMLNHHSNRFSSTSRAPCDAPWLPRQELEGRVNELAKQLAAAGSAEDDVYDTCRLPVAPLDLSRREWRPGGGKGAWVRDRARVRALPCHWRRTRTRDGSAMEGD